MPLSRGMSARLSRPSNIFTPLSSVFFNYESRLAFRSSAVAMSSNEKESEQKHEAVAAEESADFFGSGVAATARTVKEKIVSAVGLSDQKPLSDKEDMGPAGHMQGRDPNADPKQEYSSLKSKSAGGWDKAGQDKPPNQQYPGHGQNS